jgi:hypothetical protein
MFKINCPARKMLSINLRANLLAVFNCVPQAFPATLEAIMNIQRPSSRILRPARRQQIIRVVKLLICRAINFNSSILLQYTYAREDLSHTNNTEPSTLKEVFATAQIDFQQLILRLYLLMIKILGIISYINFLTTVTCHHLTITYTFHIICSKNFTK